MTSYALVIGSAPARVSTMPFEATTLPDTLPCTEFIQRYPYPAFVLLKRHVGKLATALLPVYSNKPWKNLIFGPTSDLPQTESGGLLSSLPNPTSKESIEEASKLGDWIETQTEPRFLLTLKPSWTPQEDPLIQLELVKTSVDYFWIITSIPRTPLPVPPPTPSPRPFTSSRIHRDASLNLKLTDLSSLPSPRKPTVATPMTPVGMDLALASMMEPPLTSFGMGETESARALRTFPWETSPLGPMNQWPQSLWTCLSYVMGSPYATAIWWGPELTLLYNDAYKEVAGNKHESTFGHAGSVAWGEVWNTLGPLANQVLSGEKPFIYKEDDLLFFNRLTEKKLPEESYHTWHWVPLRAEGGKIGGLMNVNFETTAKVVAARRLLILRDLCDELVLAQDKRAYAQLLFKVLKKNAVDMPFALLYYSSTEAPPKPPTSIGLAELGASTTATPQPIRVTLHLANKFGVPQGHADTPEQIEVLLHPNDHHPMRIRPLRQESLFSPSSSDTPVGENADSDALGATSEGSDMGTINASSQETERPGTLPEWPLFGGFGSGSVVHISELPESVADSLMRLGWGDKPREAVVLRIAGDGEDVPPAFLVLGLNTRRPYDKDYQTWVEVFRMTLNSTLSASLSREAEKLKAEQLAQLDAAKTTFFSSASHELRTPLTLIQGPLTDLLNIDHKDPRVKDLLKLAARNVSRLSRLVDSLMQFTRLEAGRLQGQFRAIQLDAYTTDLCSLFRDTIERSKIEFNVEISQKKEERVVYVDPDFWEKIVFNLIGNAFKYTMTGKITVRLLYDDKYCRFMVQDTGVGVPEEDIRKIFERFYRVASVSRSHEGTGIGLSLTQQLVKLHKGEILVESRTIDPNNPSAPHGSIFTVVIPMGKDHLAPSMIDESGPELSHRAYARGIVEEAANWGASRSIFDESTPSEGSFSSGTGSEGQKSDISLFQFRKEDVILVADDNSDVKSYIRSIFGRLCTIVEASNGQEALDLIHRGTRPDLVLSDVMMPVLDGYGLLNSLKENPTTQLIPVILLTAKAGDEAKFEGLLSGADDYIAKPFRSKELVARAHLQLQVGKRKMEMQKRFDLRTQEMMVLSDMSPVGIFRANSDGQVIYTNTRWHEITGHSHDLPLDDWTHAIHLEDINETLTIWNACLNLKKGGSLDMRWRNDTWTKIEVQPLSNGLIATITDISDRRLYEAAQLAAAQEREAVARQRATEAEERERESDARRRAQELLVDVTSHELRQPVSAILNCSALVRSNLGELYQDLQRSNAEQSLFAPTQELLNAINEDLEALDAIYQCGLAQERIANDVLSLSRIQLQILSIHPVDFDLVPEVQRTLSLFTNELKMKAISLISEFGTSLGRYGVARVRADKLRFAQVITNLMSNAIKFTDTSSSPRRELRILVEVSDRPPLPNSFVPPPENLPALVFAIQPGSTVYIYVAVQDSGPGLKEEDLHLLFQRFQQGSNSHDVFGGSGLGLFVSRKLCELMGGSIGVTSQYGEGATFRFHVTATAVSPPLPSPSLPIIIHASAPSSSPKPRSGRTSDLRQSLPPPITSPARVLSSLSPPARTAYHILITEDNLINQTVLNRQLKQAGFTTALANNGLQAIEQVKQLASGADNNSDTLPRRFDVILMDCEMPVMDGLTAVREIRRMEMTGELPQRNRILALTGNARAGQVESAREAGMDDVVIKPYKLDDLLARIRERAGDEAL